MSARRVTSLVVATAMMAGLVQSAQAHCTSPNDQAAFEVAALKSELSVLAVACEDDKDYNAFIERARAELVREDAVVNAWFKRTYGRAAQSRYDSYITLQANEQSVAGQHKGSDFCPRNKQEFTEVMAVPVASLPQYAAGKDLFPIDLACTSVNETASTAASRPGRPTARRAPAHR